MKTKTDWFRNFLGLNTRYQGKRRFNERKLTIEFLEERIALSVSPAFVDLPESITVVAGELFHVPLNGIDSNNYKLSFSAESSDSSVYVGVPEGNRSVKMKISYVPQGSTERVYGEIIFELFEKDTPLTTERIITLVESGFYDGLTFHRIIDGFMMQGGDPTGTGSGSSDLDTFKDEFVGGLIYTGKGLLGMANRGSNTNDCQFFITDAATMHLNYAHTIFGFVTSGYEHFEQIMKVDVEANSSGEVSKPKSSVVIEDISIVTDVQNGVLRIQTKDTTKGEHSVFVTVKNEKGEETTQEIKLNVVEAPASTTKWDVPSVVEVNAGGSVKFTLPEFDFPDDVVYYVTQYSNQPSDMSDDEFAEWAYRYVTPSGLQMSIEGREVTLKVASNLSGNHVINVVASSLDGWYRLPVAIDVEISPTAPTIALSTNSDTGTSGDAITSENNTEQGVRFVITDVVNRSIINPSEGQSGVALKLLKNNVEVQYTVIGTSSQSNGMMTVVVETVPDANHPWLDGEHALTVQQTIVFTDGSSLASPFSNRALMFVDTMPPIFIDDQEKVVLEAVVGQKIQYSCEATDRNENSIKYAFASDNIPSGMTINDKTGLVSWTPQANQIGNYEIEVTATDGAGNVGRKIIVFSFQSGADFNILGATKIDEESKFELTLSPLELEDGVSVDFDILSSNIPDNRGSISPGDDPNTAIFTWQTTENDGPGTYKVVFRLLDSEGNARTKEVTLTVNEVNAPPVLKDDLEASYSVDEHELLEIQVGATDKDIHPGNDEVLTYSLQGEVPEGMEVDPASGKITWIPGEQHGGFTYEITVRVTDNAGDFDETSFEVSVIETDSPPVFEEIEEILPAKTGQNFDFTVTARDPDYADDPEVRFNEIRYSLGENAPEGMVINPISGEITWFIPNNLIPYGIRTMDFEFVIIATELLDEEPVGLYADKIVRLSITNTQQEMYDALTEYSIAQYRAQNVFAFVNALESAYAPEQMLYDNSPDSYFNYMNNPRTESVSTEKFIVPYHPFQNALGDNISYGDDISHSGVKSDSEKESDSLLGDIFAPQEPEEGNENRDVPRNETPTRERTRENRGPERGTPKLPPLVQGQSVNPDSQDIALVAFLGEEIEG